MRKLIERCPGCGGELIVTRMECHQCDTRLEGRFKSTVFERLSPDSLAFAELFVRLKGNTKQMERELGVPYSTVRSKLDDVVQELGPAQHATLVDVDGEGTRTDDTVPGRPAPGGPTVDRRHEILERLDRGEISPDEAIRELGGETP